MGEKSKKTCFSYIILNFTLVLVLRVRDGFMFCEGDSYLKGIVPGLTSAVEILQFVSIFYCVGIDS